MILSVPDMSCGHCAAAVEAALTRADPAARVAVTVDLPARRVSVEGLTEAAAVAALAAAGFPAARV